VFGLPLDMLKWLVITVGMLRAALRRRREFGYRS
jgi:hypothetical protein